MSEFQKYLKLRLQEPEVREGYRKARRRDMVIRFREIKNRKRR